MRRCQRPRRAIEEVFRDLGAGSEDRLRFWIMYRNGRLRGMGCARVCYVALFLLDFSKETVGLAFGRSPHTIDSQVRGAYRDLKSAGLSVRGKGDLASLLMLDVPIQARRRPRMRLRDHPLRT